VQSTPESYVDGGVCGLQNPAAVPARTDVPALMQMVVVLFQRLLRMDRIVTLRWDVAGHQVQCVVPSPLPGQSAVGSL